MTSEARTRNVQQTLYSWFGSGLLLVALVLSVLAGTSYWGLALAIAASLACHVYILVRVPGPPNGPRAAATGVMGLTGIIGAAAVTYGVYLAFLSSPGGPGIWTWLGWALGCSGVMTLGLALSYGLERRELPAQMESAPS